MGIARNKVDLKTIADWLQRHTLDRWEGLNTGQQYASQAVIKSILP